MNTHALKAVESRLMAATKQERIRAEKYRRFTTLLSSKPSRPRESGQPLAWEIAERYRAEVEARRAEFDYLMAWFKKHPNSLKRMSHGDSLKNELERLKSAGAKIPVQVLNTWAEAYRERETARLACIEAFDAWEANGATLA